MAGEVQKADPTETVPSNVILRALKIIRDEYQRVDSGKYGDESSFGLIQTIDEVGQLDYLKPYAELKEAVQDGLAECKAEICGSAENISKEADKHINNDEVIMTLGKSKTVEAFFKKAVKKGRKFRVIVAECAPFCYVSCGCSLGCHLPKLFRQGHELAISLAEFGIPCTVISDSAIFTHLSRVTKVVLGTHSVMANGG